MPTTELFFFVVALLSGKEQGEGDTRPFMASALAGGVWGKPCSAWLGSRMSSRKNGSREYRRLGSAYNGPSLSEWYSTRAARETVGTSRKVRAKRDDR